MLSHRVIFHGRRVCHARKPACGACTLARDLPVVRHRADRPGRRGQAAQGPAGARAGRGRRRRPEPGAGAGDRRRRCREPALAVLGLPLRSLVAPAAAADRPATPRPPPAAGRRRAGRRRTRRPSPFADCAALTAPAADGAGADGRRGRRRCPTLELPCFTGGAAVRLADAARARGDQPVGVLVRAVPRGTAGVPAARRPRRRPAARARRGHRRRPGRRPPSLGDDLGLTLPDPVRPGPASC